MNRTFAAVNLLAVAGLTFAVSSAARRTDGSAGVRPAIPDRTASGALARAHALLRTNPRDDNALALVAMSSLARAKETADSSWYVRSQTASSAALAINPKNVPALDAAGTLANARHRFRDALTPASRSRQLAPDRFAPLEILIDANIELGRYRRGFALIDQRLRLRPDLASYSRASYMAELRGQRALAIRLMRLAADSARSGSADRAWAQTHVGLLSLGSGRLAAAERAMRAALAEAPLDSTATAGLAKVIAARGDLRHSAALFRRSLAMAPVAGVATDLAEVEYAAGNARAGDEAIALAHELDRRESANGVRLDLDQALADADVRQPDADDIARARRGHHDRPGIVGDDALGWVLTRAGKCDEGLRYARRSLRLGTRDSSLFFHAGMAARCAGRRAEALRHLRAALALNPQFSVRWAPVARRTAAALATDQAGR